MDERNATASWSGYLHQGKVGIFLGLQKINELINKSSQDLDKWKIEYESAEDIDIKNADLVESRHQVKAYKDAKYPNDYKDVLGVLEYKSDTNGKKVIKNKGFRICDFDDDLNPLPIEVNEDSRFLHTITETLGFGLTESEFNNAYKQAKYVKNPNKIKLFKYPNGKRYCALSNFNDELKMYCKNEINKILIFKNHVFKNNDIQQENILNHIISHLDNEIRKKHNEGGDTYPELGFKEIYNLIISTDTYKKLNIESIREIFVKSWVSFIQELNDSDIEYNRLHEEKIEKIVKEMYTWDDDKFIQFLRNINPNEDGIGNIDTIEDVAKVFKIDNLKDVFFQCMLEVKNEEFMVDKIGYEKDGGYLLTAINRPQLKVKSVIKSIIRNSQITNEIFHKSYLINGTIDDISFDNILDNTILKNEVRNNWGDLAAEKDKFYNPKMKFISIERAKEKLNRE
ncbi:hypothetical protein FDF97_03350 [Clostridium botulinum]|uniref:ABC-three component systems C-terminal domain-containing protein n=1 Tax=Clostridium botulinum TaxID=1491 RepID=A0AA44BNQ6_CLOBO|nr:hypothetical protein [Clostridium botulinum]NFI20123.1 hypothetical protein [Clostridium botulinum]NFQ77294.1 hypothetical protein [Clostridium botulinum]